MRLGRKSKLLGAVRPVGSVSSRRKPLAVIKEKVLKKEASKAELRKKLREHAAATAAAA